MKLKMLNLHGTKPLQSSLQEQAILLPDWWQEFITWTVVALTFYSTSIHRKQTLSQMLKNCDKPTNYICLNGQEKNRDGQVNEKRMSHTRKTPLQEQDSCPPKLWCHLMEKISAAIHQHDNAFRLKVNRT